MNEEIPERQTAVDPAAASAPAGEGLLGTGSVPTRTPSRSWVAVVGDQVLRTLAPVVIMAVAVAAWQFMSEGGIVRLLGGVPASEFGKHQHEHGCTTSL